MGKGRKLNFYYDSKPEVQDDIVIYEDSKPDLAEDEKIITVLPGENTVITTERNPALNPKVIKGHRKYNNIIRPFDTEVEVYQEPSGATATVEQLATNIESRDKEIYGRRSRLRSDYGDVNYDNVIPTKTEKLERLVEEKENNPYGNLFDRSLVFRGYTRYPGISEVFEDYLIHGKVEEGYEILPSDDYTG